MASRKRLARCTSCDTDRAVTSTGVFTRHSIYAKSPVTGRLVAQAPCPGSGTDAGLW